MKMIIKCSWCEKYMGTKGDPADERITSTICPECKKMVKKEMEDLYGKPALEPLDTYHLIEH